MRASRRVSLPVQPESILISRSNSEMSLHPPMRRRSMIQTPGVATRTRPSPPSAKSRKSSFRHSHPPTPSMSRQPSFEEHDGRFLSLPPLPTSGDEMGALYMGSLHRVLTPQDTDYSTTGAFKLGTLRITNGSPDMTPNVAAALEAVDEQGASDDNQGDYFSKGPTSEPANAHFTSLSQFHSQAGEFQDGQPKLSIRVPDGHFNGGYASGLQMSPAQMSPDSSGSPTLKTQSRLAAVDDHLFDDDNQPEISTVEVLDVRIDSSAKSVPQPALDVNALSGQGVQRTDSGFVSNSKSESSQSHSSLAKADSGYSSNVSLRSLRSGRKTTTPEKEPRTSLDSDGASPIAPNQDVLVTSIEPISETIQLEKAPTPPPKDEPLSPKQPPMSPVADAQMPTQTRQKSARQQAAKINTNQPRDRGTKPAETASPISPGRKSESSSSSSLSIGNHSQKPGRLQRLLSLRGSNFKPALTVHVTHAVDNNRVPSIPKDVEEKLREHTGLFPMTTKRLALKNQMSKETLKTILSVGSLELSRDDEMISAVSSSPEKKDQGVPPSDVADAKENSLKNTLSSMQSNFRHAAISVISSRKSIQRKPVPSREGSQKTNAETSGKEDGMLPAEAELTSYRSINSTLGSNAYDLAHRALQSPAQSKRKSVETARPHPRSVSSGTQSPEKRKSSPPVSMNNRGSFRSPPPRSPLNPQGPAVRTKSRVQVSEHTTTSAEQYAAHQGPENPRRELSASGFHYRATSCGPATRRTSMSSYRASPSSSRRNSITSVRSDSTRDLRNGQPNAQTPAGLDLKRQTSLDGGFYRAQLNAHMAQPAHRGPGVRPGWNPQNSSHTAGGQYWDQQAWLPPYVPREPHRRNLSAGSRTHTQGFSQAPYRILHSYNSPAYRNAPIWG